MRGRRASILLAGAAAALSLLAAPATAGVAHDVPVPPRGGRYIGAAVNVQPGQSWMDAFSQFERQSGRPLSIHRMYQQWDGPAVTALTRWDVAGGKIPALSITSPNWGSIVAGRHDREIVAQARAFKALGAPVLLTLNHEPEVQGTNLGSPAQYRAAWRHWVSIYRAQHVTNVSFTFIVLAASYRNGGQVATSFYPGDAYVDWLGVDGYNWYTVCQDTKWRSFADVFDGFRQWAASHHKPEFIAEVGSAEERGHPQAKADWIRDMGTTLAGWPQLKAISWFNWYPPPHSIKDCQFRVVTSRASLAAWRTFAQFSSTAPR